MRLLGLLAICGLWAQEERLLPTPAPAKKLTPIIRGKLIDAQTGEPLTGVQVRIGTSGGFTDEKGAFALPFEKPDTLSAFLLGYRTVKLPLNAPTSDLLIRMLPIESEVEEVQIISDAARESEVGVYLQRLRSLEIGELYSQELIMKRSTDFYVPNVLRRLPGVSLLSGRFVSIRGMGEKYNAFAFWAAYPAWLSYDASFGELEQLITTLLGRVEVRKFWTPELLGHFGGGMVDFQLPTSSNEGLQVSFTSEIDAGAIGQKFAYLKAPFRSPIPGDFPSPATIQASENNGRPLPENFLYGQQVRRYTVPDTLPFGLPGGLITLTYDKRFSKGSFAMRAAFSRRYLTSLFKFTEGTFEVQDNQWHHEADIEGIGRSPLHTYSQGGGISWHTDYHLSATQAVSVEGIFLMNSKSQCGLQEAEYINPSIDSTQKVYSWYPSFYTQRSWLGVIRPAWSFHKGSWQGRLQLGFVSQGNTIPQAGAMNYVRYPGTSELVYEQELYEESEIYAQVWHSRTQAFQIYAHPYTEKKWGKGDRWLQLRLGGWYSQENQRFSGRQIGFMTDTAGGGPNVLDPSVYDISNIREVYAPSHIRPGGWYLIDRTGDFHRHSGHTQIIAGYAWLRASWHPRWEALIGTRYESWMRHITHIPVATERETTFVRYSEGDLLPAFLLKHRIGEYHSLRLGTNLTLIRPPLPTQVPLRYFDFFWAFYWQGDAAIQTGRSWNIDLRYEWLRSKEKLFAISLFYKRLRKLPEVFLIPASYTLTFAYATRSRAWGEVFGTEIEMRYPIWETERSNLWSYLTLTLSESATEQSLWRKIGRLEGRLQGHAPIVGNAGLLYTHSRYEVGAFFTYTSSQIWAIGFDPYIYPHVIEQGRLMGEAQISYRLSDRWELRLAIWDFINMPYRRTQRLGNANRFDPERDAEPVWERWAYRGYLTVRYRIGL